VTADPGHRRSPVLLVAAAVLLLTGDVL